VPLLGTIHDDKFGTSLVMISPASDLVEDIIPSDAVSVVCKRHGSAIPRSYKFRCHVGEGQVGKHLKHYDFLEVQIFLVPRRRQRPTLPTHLTNQGGPW